VLLANKKVMVLNRGLSLLGLNVVVYVTEPALLNFKCCVVRVPKRASNLLVSSTKFM
jgi:hypothetical protein